MMDEFFPKLQKKHAKDLNIVPILDMLVTVIFFLLMSTSFIEYTKLSLPPSATVESATQSKIPPLAPKLKVIQRDAVYEVRLSWGGPNPGMTTVKASSEALLEGETRKLVAAFSLKFPNEKTVQISMGRQVHYQNLISAMDGARDHLPDVVLSSYTEVDAL